ncbi:MAG: hypothetical protein IJM02_02700 [Clostridia bacterium]|nr:hypothetical protein [Clostridia bacterium]
MTKAKRVIALLLAVVMTVTVFTTTGAARLVTGDYEGYDENPTAYFNSVQKYEFTAEQGCTWLLDMLDGLLYNANLKFDGEAIADETLYTVKLYAYLTSIDELMWTLYNALKGFKDADSTCLKNLLDVHVIGGLISVNGLLDDVAGDSELGDIGNLVYTALGNQNAAGRVCRGIPAERQCGGRAGTANPCSDITVLSTLLQFLSDNRNTLSKIIDGTINLTIKIKYGAITFTTLDVPGMLPDNIKPFLTNLPGAVKDLLYSKLWNTEVDAAPSGWTYDGGVQQLINWLLIDGTGVSGNDGGKSILGENFEAFLPAIADFPGGASLGEGQIQADRGAGVQTYNMNFYQLVNNALNALLSGYVNDLLYGLLIDLLKIDDSDGLGDPEIMTDMVFSLVTGAIEELCVSNGAPPIEWSSEASQYPVPKLHDLLDWFFAKDGGLATFIKIDYTGISLTPNFTQLLRDVLRILPSVVPMLGLEYPEGLIHSMAELTAPDVRDLEVDGEILEDAQIYTTFDGDLIYRPDPDDDTYYEYLDTHLAVNISNEQGANYKDPTFIRPNYVVPESAVWADILKVVLNMFIKGCYFPEWADTIPEVGAYGLASLAAKYLPENNYFERLDAYHYINELGGTYSPIGTTDTIVPLAYTENFTITKGTYSQEVTFPRAAADIGASLGAFFLNGAFDFGSVLGFWPETDTNFETYLAEFLLWGAKKYMPLFTGNYNESTGQFTNLEGNGTTVPGTWQTRFNQFISAFNTAHTYTNMGAYNKCTNTGAAIRDLIYPLIDDTLFQLIPMSWLPTWVGNGGSSALFNYWLGDSLCDLDLPQIVSLLSINENGELAQCGVLRVLLRLIDRVLGTLLGGNAVLPTCADSLGSNRNPLNLSTPTSVASLDVLLNATTLKSLFKCLLYYLAVYGKPLLSTALPIIMQITEKPVKGTNYRELGASSASDPLAQSGTSTVTLKDLQDYVDEYELDVNTVVFSGPIPFSSAAKASKCAEDIGLDDFTRTEYNNGIASYIVEIPASFGQLSHANKAAEAVSAYLKERFDKGDTTVTGTECYTTSTRVNGKTVYKVLQKLDYKTNTADMSKTFTYEQDGTTVRETIYNFTNFRRATTTVRDMNNKAKVTYGDGYILYAREDFTTNKIAFLNRRNNAIEDAQEFITEYKDSVNELGDAYAQWLMYYVKLQLKAAGIYDQDDNGSITDADGFPSQPGDDTPYPYRGSGTVTDNNYIKTNVSYNLAYASSANSTFINYALNYADGKDLNEQGQWVTTYEEDDPTKPVNRNVVLGAADTEAIVRLAIKSEGTNALKFDITPDANGNYNSGDGVLNWDNIGTERKGKIQTLCNTLGLVYDQDENTISRKCFGLVYTGSFGSNVSSFGNNDGTTLDLKPVTAHNKDNADIVNDLRKSYIEFAEKIHGLDDGIKKHFDNISWRASKAEEQMSTSYVYNALDWALAYTRDAYYPVSATVGRNKTYNTAGNVTAKYSKSSFADFQIAYDYATALRSYMGNGGTNGTQSLISEAYQNVIDAYNKLQLYTGQADWEKLINFIEKSNAALDSEVGLDRNTLLAKDTENGYTTESLNDLLGVLNDALDLYNNNFTTADEEFNDIIAEQADLLEEAYNNLAWYIPEGSLDLIFSPEYISGGGDLEKALYDKGQNKTYGVIMNVAEGEGIDESYATNGTFVNSGFTLDTDSGNRIGWNGSGRGNGTGAAVIGYVGGGAKVIYYCVIRGDVNGDARIDGIDKSFVNVLVAQRSDELLAAYTNLAADTDCDGDIDEYDMNKIKAHYTYQNVGSIDGEISQAMPTLEDGYIPSGYIPVDPNANNGN